MEQIKMKIATTLFTYNRSYHTEKVISGLKRNTMLPLKLYVFQDGLREEDDICEWKKVNALIHAIDWCDKEVNVSNENKGLANSILSGINYVFNDYDAVIVLEDDCVPTPNYIDFMTQCFEKYVNDERIYSISGYSYPFALNKGQYDIYGCGRISSWGWGTWKDRWNIYRKDYELVKKMKRDKIASKILATWGRDLEEMLVGNVRGTCDSWAVFWALNVISKGGICINPYESLIQNIGLDGSGTHCGITNQYDVSCMDEKKCIFSLPDVVTILDETVEAFAPLFGSYTAINTSKNKERILVYGVGNYFLKNEKPLNQDYYIEKFVDRYKNGYYAGKEIISPNELRQFSFEKIIVMIQDENESAKVVRDLTMQYGISRDKIESGTARYS